MLAKDEREAAARGEGCLGKAADDEPVFILRGRDKCSDALVELWATLAEAHGCRPEKVQEARTCAVLMRNVVDRKWPD